MPNHPVKQNQDESNGFTAKAECNYLNIKEERNLKAFVIDYSLWTVTLGVLLHIYCATHNEMCLLC